MVAFKIKFSTAFIKCFENKSTTKKKLKPKEKTHTAYFLKQKKVVPLKYLYYLQKKFQRDRIYSALEMETILQFFAEKPDFQKIVKERKICAIPLWQSIYLFDFIFASELHLSSQNVVNRQMALESTCRAEKTKNEKLIIINEQ